MLATEFTEDGGRPPAGGQAGSPPCRLAHHSVRGPASLPSAIAWGLSSLPAPDGPFNVDDLRVVFAAIGLPVAVQASPTCIVQNSCCRLGIAVALSRYSSLRIAPVPCMPRRSALRELCPPSLKARPRLLSFALAPLCSASLGIASLPFSLGPGARLVSPGFRSLAGPASPPSKRTSPLGPVLRSKPWAPRGPLWTARSGAAAGRRWRARSGRCSWLGPYLLRHRHASGQVGC